MSAMRTETSSTYAALPDPDLERAFYADIPAKRLIAWLVDTILTILITLLIVPFTAFTAVFYLPVLFVIVNFVYRAVGLGRHGATPGMRLMAIELHTHRGDRPDPGLAIAHTFGYLLCASFVVPQIVSIVTILITPRRQSLVDMALGTVMLNRAARH